MNNKQDIILVALFSGIGGFTKGFEITVDLNKF
jgi:site-specific DNA-cytosine methylase